MPEFEWFASKHAGNLWMTRVGVGRLIRLGICSGQSLLGELTLFRVLLADPSNWKRMLENCFRALLRMRFQVRDHSNTDIWLAHGSGLFPLYYRHSSSTPRQLPRLRGRGVYDL